MSWIWWYGWLSSGGRRRKLTQTRRPDGRLVQPKAVVRERHPTGSTLDSHRAWRRCWPLPARNRERWHRCCRSCRSTSQLAFGLLSSRSRAKRDSRPTMPAWSTWGWDHPAPYICLLAQFWAGVGSGTRAIGGVGLRFLSTAAIQGVAWWWQQKVQPACNISLKKRVQLLGGQRWHNDK